MNFFPILRQKVYEGAARKNLEMSDLVFDRIKKELDVIEKMDLAEYFYIFSLIADICNTKNWLRSPGRSTAPGSMVNYCLDITMINPMNENLIFECFLNPEVSKFANIDIDISSDNRDELIAYLKQNISEFSFGKVVFLPSENDSTDYESMIINKIEYKINPCSLIIIKYPYSLGVEYSVISDELYFTINDKFNDYEKLMKFRYNIVENNYLSLISEISQKIPAEFHPYQVPLNDAATFDFLCTSNDFSGIFQLNNEFSKSNLSDFNPRCLNDLASFKLLAFPPTIQLFHEAYDNKLYGYIDQFQGDPRVNELLSPTFGVMIYRETFIQIANCIAGFDLNKAATSYKILISSKNDQKKSQFYSSFEHGCHLNSSLTSNEIERLILMIKKNIRYTFIKSHILSYAIITYWCAFYKVHFHKLFNKLKNKNAI